MQWNLEEQMGEQVSMGKSKSAPQRLTTPKLNRWLASAVSDPALAEALRRDWRKAVQQAFQLTASQAEHLAGIPDREFSLISNAVQKVVGNGGLLRVDRKSENSAGDLYIEPAAPEGSPRLRIPILHCSFAADCSDWSCGPG